MDSVEACAPGRGDAIPGLHHVGLWGAGNFLLRLLPPRAQRRNRAGGRNADTDLRCVEDSHREFVAIASELAPLESLAIYHTGAAPPGTELLPADAPFRFDPPVPPTAYNPPERVRGFLLGYFGVERKPSHVLAVNLDYKTRRSWRSSGRTGLRRLMLRPADGRRWAARGPNCAFHPAEASSSASRADPGYPSSQTGSPGKWRLVTWSQ